MNLKRHLWGESSGQVIVIFALLLVVLLGVAGLAIDGGSIYLADRSTQNSVDAALLSAAYTLCTEEGYGSSTAALDAGYRAAAANGFVDMSSDDGSEVTLPVEGGPDRQILLFNPPRDAEENPGLYNNTPDEFIEAVAWMNTSSYLIKVVYPGRTEISLDGMVRCDIPANGAELIENYTMFALSPEGEAFKTSGNSNNYLCGGGIASNSDAKSTNNADVERMANTCSCTCPYPMFYAAGTWDGDDNLPLHAIIQQETGVVAEDPLAYLAPFSVPVGAVDLTTPNGGAISGPTYYDGDIDDGVFIGDPNREDNILYITGNVGFGNGDVTFDNMMVYVGGDAKFHGETEINAMPHGPWAGFALWVNGDLTMNAQSDNNYVGTIYVPNGETTINGGSNNVFYMQLISDTIKINGGSDNKYYYNSALFFEPIVSPIVSVVE